MTVPNTTRSHTYPGDDTTTIFQYPFRVSTSAMLIVTLIDAGDVETVQTDGVDYTVDGIGNAQGGNVTMTVAPATGETLRLERTPSFLQLTDLRNQGTYLPQSVEDALDYLMWCIQVVAGGAVVVTVNDPDAIHDNIANEISAVAAKGTPVDADVVLIEDSASGFVKKKVAFSAIGGNASGSNQGTDGEGVFDTLVGEELQFRHVAPGSSMVTVTLNGKDIDIDAVAAEILEDLFSGTGLLVRTGAGTYTTRIITAGTNVTVDDGDGVAGNPTINAEDGHDNTIYTDTGPDNRPTANAANLNLSYMVQNPAGYMRRETIYRKLDGSTYDRKIEWTSFN